MYVVQGTTGRHRDAEAQLSQGAGRAPSFQAGRGESWLSTLCVAQLLPPTLPELFQKEWFQVSTTPLPFGAAPALPAVPRDLCPSAELQPHWAGAMAQCRAVCAVGPLRQRFQSTHSPGECPTQLWGWWGWYSGNVTLAASHWSRWLIVFYMNLLLKLLI